MEVQRIIHDQDGSGLLNPATTVDSTLQEQIQKPSVIKQSSTWTSSSDTSTLSESSDSIDSYRTPIVPFLPSEKQESSDTSKSSSASLENISPPVAEIQFQIRHRSETATVHQEDNDEYKTRYFCGQRDLHVLQEQMHHVCEENRLLRRKLIELQKQLFHNVRTKRRVVEANSAWSVPESASLRHKKRQRNNVSIVEKDMYLEHNTSNGRDDLCSSNDLLQTSCDAVISTVTSEELSVSSSKA